LPIKCPNCQSENPETSHYCFECGASLRPQEEIPTKILKTPYKEFTQRMTLGNRFEIIEKLGSGGMGSVYRALDRKIDEEVAIKVIRPEIVSSQKNLDRFANELKLARKINHKNVGRMYEIMESESTHFITMEYVQGQDLKSLIKQTGQLTAKKAIAIAEQIGEGLAEAHRLGVIHRDLKSSNVMIDKQGNAHITDFGIARSVQAEGITRTGVILGTPEYMSPEQVSGIELDERSDIYSLGVILYEMVTGKLPFGGDTPLSVAMKHKSEVPETPGSLNAEISEDLNQMILKCMEKDREKRYQNAKEVVAALHNLGEKRTTTVTAFPKEESLRGPYKKFSKKKAYFYGSLAILTMIVVLVVLSFVPRMQMHIGSIAVLPLLNLSEDPQNEYFSDGMTEALISELAKIRSLRVISNTSVMKYKGQRPSIPEIVRELNVDAILEGSVLHADGKVRIIAQLIQTNPERQIWNDSYERELSDILTLQREMARAITNEIQIRLSPEEEARLERTDSVDPNAYVAYLRGRYFWSMRTEEGYRKAIDYFQQAIDIAPDYALAHAGLADTYIVSDLPDPDTAMIRARVAARKALEIDEDLAEAHTTLAFADMFEWNWEAAERGFKRAIELNPSYATARHWYGLYLSWTGLHDEALAQIRRARELDPLSLAIDNAVGNILFWARRFDEAIDHNLQTLEVDENYERGHRSLGFAYLLKGLHEKALSEFMWLVDHSGVPEDYTAAAIAYAKMGKTDEVQEILSYLFNMDENAKLRRSISYELAHVYVALGEFDTAFDYLNRALEENSGEMVHLNVGPLFDPLREDPRFEALLDLMNFPEIE
jgi:serine/threonine protein kinase/Tfp pilus assembly protein PilF